MACDENWNDSELGRKNTYKYEYVKICKVQILRNRLQTLQSSVVSIMNIAHDERNSTVCMYSYMFTEFIPR